MRKVAMISFILIIMIVSGCSKSTNDIGIKVEDNLTIKYEKKLSDLESAAKVQELEVKDILINKDFYGGNVGETEFHGGKVLLWRVEDNRLRVRCSLNMGDGNWRSTNITSDLMTNDDSPFIATEMMVNDADENERKVPLWVFYGVVNDTNIQRIRVNFIGFSSIEATVQNGIWMAIYQGVKDETNKIKYEAMDSNYQILYTDEQNFR